MGVEIERKFLVRNDSWRAAVISESELKQGYIAQREGLSVRVRIKGEKGFLTIKSGMGIRRGEFEYEIPRADAEQLLRDSAESGCIEKTRYRVRSGAHVWDLDVFGGDNAGLVVAEIELAREDETFEIPGWVGAEVSGDPRYYNVNLARTPFARW